MSAVAPLETLAPRHIDDLLALYRGEWWTADRSRDEVTRLIAGSDVVVGFEESATGALVGFARALSDGVIKAMIFDVIVAPAHRGSGLGRRVMDRLLDHPKVRPARHKELYCLPEMEPFYEHWGFTAELGGVRLMRASV